MPRRETEPRDIVLHRLVVIEQELPSVGKPDSEQIGIGSLATPAARVNDKVFNLEKTV